MEERGWKRRLLPAALVEGGIQFLLIPAMAAILCLLASFIWSLR